MHLVVGSTGVVGSKICAQLVEQGKRVRALVRKQSDPERVAKLRDLGAETVVGDLKDAASLARACEGVSCIVSTASSMPAPTETNSIADVDRDGQKALVAAAKAAGVEKFVFLSASRVPGVEFPLAVAKAAVEEALKQSGMDYTILQASYFHETWLTPIVGFDFASGNVRIYGDGNSRMSFVSNADVASCAVASVDADAARNKTIKIGGPDSLTPLEVVKIFEEATGRTFSVEKVPEEALRQQLAVASNPVEASFAGLMTMYAVGDGVDITEQRAVFPHVSLTSVRDYAARVGKGVETSPIRTPEGRGAP